MCFGKCLLYCILFFGFIIILIVFYSQDPFLHFSHIGGWAAHISSGVPPNRLGCVSMQVYSKYKTRFYKYQPGKDRHGVSLDAERIYNQRIKRFDVSFPLYVVMGPQY